MILTLIVIGVILLLAILYVVFTYYSLLKLSNRIRDKWSLIDSQLKKKFDLIPQLLNASKVYAKNESDILKCLIEARNKFVVSSTSKQKMEANSQLSMTFKRFMSLGDNNMDLKKDVSFLELRKSLKDIDDELFLLSESYNDLVLSLNKKVNLFPSRVVASLFGFKKEILFQMESQKASLI